MHADAVYGLFWGQDFEDYTISFYLVVAGARTMYYRADGTHIMVIIFGQSPQIWQRYGQKVRRILVDPYDSRQ